MKRLKKVSLIVAAIITISACGNRENDYSNSKNFSEHENSEEILIEEEIDNTFESNISSEKETNSNSNYRRSDGYTNKVTGETQRQYKGSVEQQRDLEMIDEWIRNNPDVY